MRMSTLAVFILASTLAAQTPSQHGVFVEDIDRNANACDDFYQYANGAWRAANPMPASMRMWSRRWAAGELAKEQLRDLLQDESKRKDWPKGSIDQQITDLYGACMEEKAIDALGMEPIRPYLREIDAIRTPAQLQAMLAELHDIGISAAFSLRSTYNTENPSQVIAELFPARLSLSDRDYYFKTEQRFADTRKEFVRHVAKMFELIGRRPSAAAQDAETVFAMEKRLAAPQLDRVALRDPAATDHKYMFETVGKMTPHFDWKRFFDRAAVPPGEVNVAQPLYMETLEHELRSTPLSTWRTYLKWRLVDAAAEQLSTPFAEEHFAFYGKYLRGQKENKPRWKRCVELDDDLLGEALGQRYVERYFPPAAKARMQELVKNILLAMGETIRGLEWMTPATKEKALEKLSTFNPKVGYPDKWTDYSSVVISPSSHFANVLAGRKFGMRDELARIGKPVDRGRWEMTPPTSNAYYNPPLNEIVFPAGILQPPAFDANATDAVNYGAIGVVIGHEISHGFDDQGSKYDAQGRLRNWWTPEDLKRFQEKTACVAKQFDEYSIEPGIHHNGRLVLGEAIGDLAGAKIAWRAFQMAQKDHPAPTLDGLTPAQQFFIAWGQFRGDEIRPESQRLMIQIDPHPVSKFRVIGPLSNLPEFAAAFSCPAGSPMVRATPCEVW